jgi:enolase
VRSERTAKWNRLPRLEAELGADDHITYAGGRPSGLDWGRMTVVSFLHREKYSP